MTRPVFEYTDPVDFLKSVYDAHKSRNPRFSLTRWAQMLDLPNTAMISRILERKRNVSPAMAKRLASKLRLSEDEQLYFVNLAIAHGQVCDPKVQEAARYVARKYQTPGATWLEPDRFQLIADWQHLAILEMTRLRGFQWDPAWIERQSRGHISLSVAAEAMRRLQEYGLYDPVQKCQSYTGTLATGDKFPHAAVREHHRQVIQRSLESIQSVPFEERHLKSMNIAVRADKKAALLQLLCDFERNVLALSTEKDADEVVQISFQVLPVAHTQRNEA